MENTQPSIEPITPQIQQTQNSQPVVESPRKKSALVPILLGLAVLILGGIFGLLVQQKGTIQPSSQTQVISPTPTITVNTNKPLSAIATTSAFMQTETTITSLSSAAAILNVSDTTLNPPTLDLSLGLDTK